MPVLDERTEQDILKEFEDLAGSYVPEWKEDWENCDAGSGLAKLYAGLFKRVLALYNDKPQQLKQAYFRQMGADLLPGIPAGGEVEFFLAGKEVPDVFLPASSRLWVKGESGEKLYFELMEDVAVSISGKSANTGRIRAVKPGPEGNLPKGSVFHMAKSAGFITKAMNPYRLYGGCGPESWEQAQKRSAFAARHLDRAVTSGDFEALVESAGGYVDRAKCFAGYNKDGKAMAGAVTVVVLRKDYREGRRFFYQLEQTIYEYLRDRTGSYLAQGGRLFITQPWFVPMDVTAELAVDGPIWVSQAEEEGKKAIEAYLDPVEGGYDGSGWKMGQLPDHSRLRHVLLRVPHVKAVNRIGITAKVERDGVTEDVDLRQALKFPWSLPLSGSHRITAIADEKEKITVAKG